MNKVVDVLDYYGCDEIRIQGKSRSLSGVEEAFGTTHETYVRLQDEPPRIRLIDPETGEEIGRTRIAVDGVREG
jgi:uncharacterized heparinase superfamily protein